MLYDLKKSNVGVIKEKIFFPIMFLKHGYEEEWMFVIDFYHSASRDMTEWE